MNKLLNFFLQLGAFVTFVAESIWLALFHPPQWSLIRDQLFEFGVRSLPVIILTGFSTGMVLSAQAFFQLSDKGLTGTTGIMVAKSMLVEIGPVLTSFMMTGRIGAAICAELGSMKVTEQIDALVSMSVHPIRYLVVPRLIAMLAMMPCLTAISCATGIFGGYLLAVNLYGMSSATFLDPIPDYLNWYDLFSGIFKCTIFGLEIVMISCFYGMNTSGGAVGVGRATTSSVVMCYSCILISNFLITICLNAFYWVFFAGYRIFK